MSDDSVEEWDDSDKDPNYEEESEKASDELKSRQGKVSRVSRKLVTRQSKKPAVKSTNEEVQAIALGGRSVSPSKITALELSESDSSDEESLKPCRSQVNIVKESSYFSEIGSPVVKPEKTNYDFSDFFALQKSLSTAREIYEKEVQNPKFTKPEVFDLSISELLSKEKQTDRQEEFDSEPDNEEETKVVQITLKSPDKKQSSKQKKQASIFERQLQLIQKENQILIDKVHILCWIAHGNYINSMLINDKRFQTLFLLPRWHDRNNLDRKGQTTNFYFKKLLSFFSERFVVVKDIPSYGKISFEHLFDIVYENMNTKYSIKDLVVIFVAFLRHLNVPARLVISLQPTPLKPKKRNTGEKVKKKSDSAGSSKDQDSDSEDITKSIASSSKNKKSLSKSSKAKGTESKKSVPIHSTPKRGTGKKGQLSSAEGIHVGKLNSTSSENLHPKKVSTQCSAVKGPHVSKNVSVPSTSKNVHSNKNKAIKEKNNSGKQAKPSSSKKSIKVLSSDSEEEENNEQQKKEINYWVEAYNEKCEKWISIDLYSLKVDCPREIYARCTKPAVHILAWQNDGTLKEVTKRYVPSWHISSNTRIDKNWFDKTIQYFVSKNSKSDRDEDIALQECETEMNKPFPRKLADYKNHPLYVLKRHLLKFEAIYPPDAEPVGHIKYEAIFSRFCVYELHSRDKWMREGKVVKVNEKPYKVVKSHFKCKVTGAEKFTELFGAWQVVDYIPPPVIDNVIPRNEYGNIEVYKPSMLPAGTVHLQVPGILRLAKKMNIDCVPAVVGWEYGRNGSHPVIEGGVICKEFQELIMDAWCAEAENAARRSKHKRRQKLFKLWYQMGKLQVIKARLKRKYNFFDDSKNKGNDYEPPNSKERKMA